MPTPIGHALGGLATAWLSRALRGTRAPRPSRRNSSILLGSCVAAAVAADLDILIHNHRSYTHSLGAAVIVGVIAWCVARNLYVALTIAAAYGTHIVLDWLGKDTAPPFGLPALWPFSSRFYISGADLFMEISRRYWKPGEFIVGNLKAGGWELLVLGPLAALAWWCQARGKRREPEVRSPESR